MTNESRVLGTPVFGPRFELELVKQLCFAREYTVRTQEKILLFRLPF